MRHAYTREILKTIAILITLHVISLSALAQPTSNLLRNGDFQDDWLTVLPETKNHHWCYSSEFFNRRDYNPDGWVCKGSWKWEDADAPRGQRRMILTGPEAQVMQRVNMVAVHDDRVREGFPDAGGFPHFVPQRSKMADRVLGDLSEYTDTPRSRMMLRVRVQGRDVPAKAATIELGLCPIGGIDTSDPMGTLVPPAASAKVDVPGGTYDWKWIEVSLPASVWLRAMKDAAAQNPKEAAEMQANGLPLPGMISVVIHYHGGKGELQVDRAELTQSSRLLPGMFNRLPNGDFESIGKDGYPTGWSRPAKYTYIPPGHYYIFNTWHNQGFANRGLVELDSVIVGGNKRSLKMIVPPGDETSVSSDPITLNQKEPRLIEVAALIKTDHLQGMQIDAIDENGNRLDGFDFINKAPMSIGTNDWRQVRQVFRPRAPVKSIRLMLCARGVNGYTLDDTTTQPQNNVVGTIWWDNVSVIDPESNVVDFEARGLSRDYGTDENVFAGVDHLYQVDLGEQKLGANTLITGIFVHPESPPANKELRVRLELTSPSGKRAVFQSTRTRPPLPFQINGPFRFLSIPYTIDEACPAAYSQYHGTLSLIKDESTVVASTDLWFGVWTTPIDLQLGSLYLQPEQTKQFIRMNLGFSSLRMAKMSKVKLELIRRGSGQALSAMEISAAPAAILAQREKIPMEMRGELSNLLLADMDVSALPLQPFNDPQRNWIIRATALDEGNKTVAVVDSQPFCRLAHEAPQPAIQSVTVDKNNLLYVNGQPWMPWGAIYGFIPVYNGVTESPAGADVKYRDLHNLPGWNIYDRFTPEPYNRKRNDLNCLRYVAGGVTGVEPVTKAWTNDNLYASSVFVAPQPPTSLADFYTKAGGETKAAEILSWCKSAPMVVSTAPGIEEAFGDFHRMTPEQIDGLAKVVDHIRAATGKPVMIGHGGDWNRFEFEKAPRFDIYDPETEPLFPANLHTDLMPLIRGQASAVWLRPQMYEDVPYERWRFHVWVELMRGCRGWQMAHGPGDQSLFRGLHAEMESFKPIAYSTDSGPVVSIEPTIEHWSRRYNGKTYIIAATTHGITLGDWSWDDSDSASPTPAGRPRVTDRSEDSMPRMLGIDDMPDSRVWPADAKIVQWARVDGKSIPENLVVMAKVNGRWTHAASWGTFDAKKLRGDKFAYWFLTGFYRNYAGFLGWGKDLVPKALDYVLNDSADMGVLPASHEWVKLEVPLSKIGAADKLLSGVACIHEGGEVVWGRTSIVLPNGSETVVWGDAVGYTPESLEKTKIKVAGLKTGTKVRVLFEDREITAGEGEFVDDFRGQDLYQRYGGRNGYGSEAVALHVYEVP